MQNIILDGMLKEFTARHGLDTVSEQDRFEMFCNYCALANDHYDSFSFDKVATGDAQGVDGVAVVIGDIIVDEISDANHFTQSEFRVTFNFIQAKTSASFSLGDFLKFTSTVRLFFGHDKNVVPVQLQNAFDIKELIYQRAGKLVALPVLKLWYGYVGRFQVDSPSVNASIQKEIATFEKENYLFSCVKLGICDGDTLAVMFREAQNNTVGKVSFQRHVALPNIEKATAAYIGVMKCKDYIRFISKQNGEINKSLFYDNVRDFLGRWNPVNRDIKETINSPASRDQFAILNNGVTVVAKKVVPSGDVFEIQKFQIVNGCQTSHVLFSNSSKITDDMYVTVKLIETQDVDLTNSIVRSANSQSQVTKEAFATIRPYHRVLEDFFTAMRAQGFNFYYERRPHQFDSDFSVKESQVVSVPIIMKAFISVVMDEPHKVHYYYGRLLEEYNSQESSELFSEDDYPGLYFASQLIVSKVREKVGKDKYLKHWEYHISMLIKRALAPELRRGVQFSDKNFRLLIGDIGDGFDGAFSGATAIIRSRRRDEKENRLPEVTAGILREFKPQHTQARVAQGKSPSDGDYIGRLDGFDASNNQVVISYGSRTITAPAPPVFQFETSCLGKRIRFTKFNEVVISSVLV